MTHSNFSSGKKRMKFTGGRRGVVEGGRSPKLDIECPHE